MVGLLAGDERDEVKVPTTAQEGYLRRRQVGIAAAVKVDAVRRVCYFPTVHLSQQLIEGSGMDPMFVADPGAHLMNQREATFPVGNGQDALNYLVLQCGLREGAPG